MTVRHGKFNLNENSIFHQIKNTTIIIKNLSHVHNLLLLVTDTKQKGTEMEIWLLSLFCVTPPATLLFLPEFFIFFYDFIYILYLIHNFIIHLNL